MAGQEQRGSRDRGQSSPHGLPAALAEVASAGSGTGATTRTPSPARPTTSSPTSTASVTPTPTPRAVSRLLQMKGLTADEAANLTAFLYGLPTADLRWTVRQLNTLLFLREMRQSGRFRAHDGGSASGA
jgi:hypothetical protein